MCKGMGRLPKHYKLTPEQVQDIREDKRRPLKIIAYDYGVGISCIWDIINRKSWTNVGDKDENNRTV
jgi:hypothetical protein